jgi:hypothetical protein
MKSSPIKSVVTRGHHPRDTDDYWSDVTVGNHVSDETLTTGPMYPRQSCQ